MVRLIIMLVFCIVILFMEGLLIGSATSGAAIIFERENVVGGLDVGHVGVAIQDPRDDTWYGGAIEGSEGQMEIALGEDNGGWAFHFKTKEDVINEFATNREYPSSGIPIIPPHAAYDKYKIIYIETVRPELAIPKIVSFNSKTGYSIPDNDCLTNAYAVLQAYGAGEKLPDIPDPLDVISYASTTGSLVSYYSNPNHRPKNVFDQIDEDEVIIKPAEVDVKEADASGWKDKGDVFFDQDLDSEAITAYDQAIRLDPYFAEAWSGKGAALTELGRYNEGLQACDKAIEFKPNLADAWVNKANALTFLGKYDESVLVCDKAIELDPNNAIAWGIKGGALIGLERYDESLQAFDRATELNPNISEFWTNKGTALYELGRYEDSLQACDKSIELDPNDATAWAVKGYALKGLDWIAESKAAFAKAKELGYRDLWLFLYL